MKEKGGTRATRGNPTRPSGAPPVAPPIVRRSPAAPSFLGSSAGRCRRWAVVSWGVTLSRSTIWASMKLNGHCTLPAFDLLIVVCTSDSTATNNN